MFSLKNSFDRLGALNHTKEFTMATLSVINPNHPAASPNRQPTMPQEQSFLEITFRVALLTAGIFTLVLATLVYPVLAPTCFFVSYVITYSKISGLPVRDLADRFFTLCSCAPLSQSPIRRNILPFRTPPVPGSSSAMLSIPIRFAPSTSPEASPRAEPSQQGPLFQAQKRGLGQLPDTSGFVPSSLLNSGIWNQK